VLHRDIKPSNVLLQEDGHTKLTDFGIAKGLNQGRSLPTNPDETMTGVVLGTPGYLAPERAAGLPASVQSDLYSVGAVMVEALTGDRIAVGSELPQGLPPFLHYVASRAMAVDPRSRFESADAMLTALQPPANPAEVPTGVIVSAPIPAGSSASSVTSEASSPPTNFAPPDRTAALTSRSEVVQPRRRRKIWAALALAAMVTCALVVSLFVILEGGAQTTGRDLPPRSAHVTSNSTVVTSTTIPLTTTTFLTTTTVPKHHGKAFLHQLHQEERDGILPPGPGIGRGRGAGGGPAAQG
jgi:serine/threonine protein kinase